MVTINNCDNCERLADNKNLLKRLQDMIDYMPIMCNVFDKDFVAVDCNKRTCEVFEMTKEEFCSRFNETLPEFQPDGRPSVEKAIELIKLAFKEGTCSFDWIDRKLDGELLTSFVTLVRFEWKHEMYVVAFVEDRRDYHKLQEAERSTKERMKNMLDASPNACLVIDQEYRLTEMNNVFKVLFRLEEDLITLERFIELSPKYQPDGRLSSEKLFEMILKALEVGRNRFEWIHQTTLKEAIPCEVTLVKSEQQDRNYVIAYIQDLREAQKAAEMADKLKKMEELAYTDPLTGAYNRRYFMERSAEELDKLEKGSPYSVIILDIDFFKRINDTYGHPIGDEVLKILVARLKNVLKQGTVFARFGGEEFIVLLPLVDHDTAMEVGWRINKAVEAHNFNVNHENIFVTVSCGVGVAYCKTSDIYETIASADKALYSAKAAGRNTVISEVAADYYNRGASD